MHPEADRALRQDRGQPLRHHLRLYQEHAGLRSGRGGLLSGENDLRRGGRALHRPQDHDLRFRGCGKRRSHGADGGGVRGPGCGAHRFSGVADHPGPGGGLRGLRPQEQFRRHGHQQGHGVGKDEADQRARPSAGRPLRRGRKAGARDWL